MSVVGEKVANKKKPDGRNRRRGEGTPPPIDTGKPIKAPPPDKDPLTVQERLFVNEFLVHRNGLRAYRKVYGGISYGAAGVGAHDLLKKPKIKAEIQAYLKAQEQRTRITADRVLKEIGRIAFVDPEETQNEDGTVRPLREIPVEVRKAIAGFEVSRVRTYTDKESGVTTEESVLKYKFWDKNVALAKLAKHLGLDAEVPPLEALLGMFPKEVATAVREALAKSLNKE